MPADPLYLHYARQDIGLREVKGPRHNSRIVQMLARLGAWWRDDETPWCGVALAAWLQKAGFPVPGAYYRALSWAAYGLPAPGPVYGAIAVMARKGGGHVGIVTGVSASGGHVRLLGGNQNDSVCEAWFPATRITAYRLPEGAPIAHSPVVAPGEMSRSEA